MQWKCGAFSFDISRPLIMGVLNVTPDSFSDGGTHNLPDQAVAFAYEMVAAGADIIDVGGESTRPGSSEVSEEEELERVLNVVRALAGEGLPVSIDTRHAGVARACVDAGACIVNDVSGFRDEAMREVARASSAGLVVMHMLGEPKHMQDSPEYADVVAEVEEYLLARAHELEASGIESARICIDPGPGFGKTFEQTSTLIAGLPELVKDGYPVMAAVSRKSFIGNRTGIETPAERDLPSALCAAAACEDGAVVVRVHDVALTKRMLESSRHAVVALGSNIEPRLEYLDAAVDALNRTPGIWITRLSSYVETEPAYYADQDRFANAVALVQTSLSPEELLAELHRIEQEQHRERHFANGPRTLDLDIVDYEGVVSGDADLVLPHPRALERDFVMTPLLEVAPGYVFADGTTASTEQIQYGRITSVLRHRP